MLKYHNISMNVDPLITSNKAANSRLYDHSARVMVFVFSVIGAACVSACVCVICCVFHVKKRTRITVSTVNAPPQPKMRRNRPDFRALDSLTCMNHRHHHQHHRD